MDTAIARSRGSMTIKTTTSVQIAMRFAPFLACCLASQRLERRKGGGGGGHATVGEHSRHACITSKLTMTKVLPLMHREDAQPLAAVRLEAREILGPWATMGSTILGELKSHSRLARNQTMGWNPRFWHCLSSGFLLVRGQMKCIATPLGIIMPTPRKSSIALSYQWCASARCTVYVAVTGPTIRRISRV